jgi:CxxC motif-containing protein (DUF1111 family)
MRAARSPDAKATATALSRPANRVLMPAMRVAVSSGVAIAAVLVWSTGGLSADDSKSVERGRAVFHATWVPPGTAKEFTGLGPVFNTDSCASCHVDNGRGAPPRADDRLNTSLVVKFATDESGAGSETIRRYGNRFNYKSVTGVPVEGDLTVSFERVEGTFADGEPYTLHRPRYGFGKLSNGPVDKSTIVAVRMAPAIVGRGLLEKVPEDWIRARADANAKSEGPVKGRPNVVWDPITFRMTVGRFGWKADQPNLTRIIAAAFITDMGLTSRLFPQENCGDLQPECQAAAAPHRQEVDDPTLDAVTRYVASLAPPTPRHDPADEGGRAMFTAIGCASCHATKVSVVLADRTTREISPYTDLLLHDMGDGLADGTKEAAATGREWRTAPLWGLGQAQRSTSPGYLHDGRAHSVSEAILWHGGEAATAREAFVRLDAQSRAALLKFLDGL